MSVARLPPQFANTDHRQRCLEQLRSKSVSLEKYIYLNGLKGRDSNLFYEMLLGNMSVSNGHRTVLSELCQSLTSLASSSSSPGNNSHSIYSNGEFVSAAVETR